MSTAGVYALLASLLGLMRAGGTAGLVLVGAPFWCLVTAIALGLTARILGAMDLTY